MIILAVAALVTAAAVLFVRGSWNRAVSRPFPVRGANAWAARQPGWLLAAIGWAPLAALIVGLGLGLRLPWFFMPLVLTTSGIAVTGSVAQSKVLWQHPPGPFKPNIRGPASSAHQTKTSTERDS